MKIISHNVGHFLGFQGTKLDYLLRPHRGIISDQQQKNRIRQEAEVIESEDPDVVCLQETDLGSIRSRNLNQPEYLKKHLDTEFKVNSDPRYNSFLRNTPQANKLGASTLHLRGSVETHYLKGGVKSLVHEISTDEISIFSVHLPRFRKKSRWRFLQHLSKILEKREKWIVVGDFNTRKPSEQRMAEEILEGSAAKPGPTFPASNPEHAIDYAVASSQNLVESVNTIDTSISDHRPIVVETSDHLGSID